MAGGPVGGISWVRVKDRFRVRVSIRVRVSRVTLSWAHPLHAVSRVTWVRVRVKVRVRVRVRVRARVRVRVKG